MSAKVQFLGLLKEFQPERDDSGFWYLPSGTTIQEIVDMTGVQNGTWEFVITVNGGSVLRNYPLADGDEVIFSTIFLGG